jgi:hypothetical protein
MEQVIEYFKTLNLDYSSLGITAGILLLGSFIFGSIGRFVFGKHSVLADSASSTLGILAIYIVGFVLCCSNVNINWIPLPFMTLSNTGASVFSFAGWDYRLICGQVLNMVILSFIMNLLDRWLPKGKSIFTFLLMRILCITAAALCYTAAMYLANRFLPIDFMLYAPTILLGLLVLMLATGALKIIVGVILSTVNPLIAALYTFFFANIIGKQVTKAVFTTVLMTACAYVLDYLAISFIPFSTDALIIFVPCLLIILVLWRILRKIF